MLSISITSNNDKAFSQQVSVADRATIGRNPASDIHLPDPDKHISRLHAQIEQRDGEFHLTVASRTNFVSVNDKYCNFGNDIVLNVGDRIGICNYTLTITELVRSATSNQASPASTLETFITAPSSPWSDATVPSSDGIGADPFGLADLMVKPAARPSDGADPFAMLTPVRHGLVENISPIVPDEHNVTLDPMAALNKRDSHNPLNITSRPTSSLPFDDILNPQRSNTNLNAFGSGLASSPLVDLGGHHPTGSRPLEHVHDINLPFNPPPVPEPRASEPSSSNASRITDDPFADTLRTYISKIAAASPEKKPESSWNPSPAPDSQTAPAPLWPSQTAAHPLASETHPISATAQPVPEAVTAPSDHEQMNSLLEAFRKAAGLARQEMTPQEALAYMESIGTILRASIEGIVSLLASRSMLKGELGAEDRTMVATRDNNPLKFMPDIKEVMQFLFDNKKLNSSTYLSPVQSIQGACEDLIFHELGTAAGMRAAVEGSIRRFNPQLIEGQFNKSGKKMVLNRKAALWETYVENYRKIEESMADDVGHLFERDFRRAYDNQIRKLKVK